MSSSSNDSKLRAVERELSKISSSMARGAKITAFIGVILVVAMIWYFRFGFGKVAELLEPDQIVSLIGVQVGDSLPEIRKSVQSTVKDQAPDWAQAISDQAIGATPTIRESLEDHILSQTEGVISNGVNLGEAEFRKILRENKSAFEDTLDELAEGEEFSEETMQIFLEAVNKELGRDMEDQAEEVLGTLIALNEKLQKLSSNTSLNKEEALERQTLMVIRRLQLQEQDAQILEAKKKIAEAAAAARAEAAKAELESEDPDAAPAEGEEAEKPADEKPADDAPAETTEEAKDE